MPARRRLPPLLDAAVLDLNRGLAGALLTQDQTRRIRDLAARAQRFVFDADASAYLGRFIRDCGDLVLSNLDFALLPSPVTYVEVDLDSMLTALGKPQTSTDMDRDSHCGILAGPGGSVYTCVRGLPGSTYGEQAVFSPVLYHLDSGPRPRDIYAGPSDEWRRLAMLLGSTIHDLPDEDVRRRILDSSHIELLIEGDRRRAYTELLTQGSHHGDVRTLWAALLLINQPRGTNLVEVGPRAALAGAKRCVYARHTVVQLDVCPSADEMRRRVVPRGGRESPRRHPVRGHFRHWRLGPGCEHGWVSDADASGVWDCQHCGGTRRWIAATHRGDAGKGYVTHDYEMACRSGGLLDYGGERVDGLH